MNTYSFNTDRNSTTFVIHELSHNPVLNDWEDEFIKSIKEHYASGKFLSDNQMQKLSDLWEKY